MDEKVGVRLAEEKDIDEFLELVFRMKRLNGEFDSMFTTNEKNKDAIKKYYLDCIKDREKYISIVSEYNGKICGLLKAEVRNRISYLPDKEARIIDLYIMPEFRRKTVGNLLLDKLYSEMGRKELKVVTAEFPSLNLIALNFYQKIGYKQVASVFGKVIGEDKKD
jgi:ribosomal protein S18 acetylase RimI-like enzyme